MLVEEMAPRGVELIVGARRDPQWGPVLMVGLGGIWTEALDDVRLMPADTPHDGIMAELYQLKGARLLDGFRGSEPVNVRAIADVVMTRRRADALTSRDQRNRHQSAGRLSETACWRWMR